MSRPRSSPPLAQRRNLQAEQAEPGEQILAEPSLGDQTLQIAVRGGDHANVDLDLSLAAQRPDLLVFQDAQELDLESVRHLAHFIEKERASVGRAEETLPFGLGPGECATDVPEQLVLEHRFGQSSAVHAHQRTGSPRPLVEKARQDLLARARFAFDEEPVGGARQPRRLRELELPLRLHGGRVRASREGLQVEFADASRRVAEEEECMADLQQGPVAERQGFAEGSALPIDHRPVRRPLVSDEPVAAAAFEMRVVRGSERVTQIDAQGRAAALGAEEIRTADVRLGEARQRVPCGRLGEVIRGDQPEQQRA